MESLDYLSLLVDFGFEVNLTKNLNFEISPAYRSGFITANFSEMTLTSRYDEVTDFRSLETFLEEFLHLLDSWYERSSWLWGGWEDKSEPHLVLGKYLGKS